MQRFLDAMEADLRGNPALSALRGFPDFDVAVQLDPLEPHLLRSRARALRESGRHQEALADGPVDAEVTYVEKNLPLWGEEGRGRGEGRG